jgi:glycosyltransferase involved in cell wall biosynthesis/CDP-glycerol glycerophosphotransferase (TagB/SpsB family)
MSTARLDPALAPRFSIVTPVYNVARYLGEFIESIEQQQFPLDRVEVIVVDDGSTDESLSILRAWQDRRPELVTVLSKENGGQSSARNFGMEHARGEWITFPDPDDILDPDYLAEVDAFLLEKPTTVLVAARRILFDDATGKRRAHPLQILFTGRNRLRNLDRDTAHFHGSAPCGFFRLDLVRAQELVFDERIRPSFEDGNFCCRYLLHVGTPYVGFVMSAVYLYRKRSDSSSTLDRSWVDPRRYTDMPEFGFLDLLREGAAVKGAAPRWLQSMVLYELSWYFKVEDAIPWVATAVDGEIADRFHQLMRSIVPYFEPDVIAAYPNGRLRAVYRDMIAHSFSDEPWHTPFAIVDKIDAKQHLLRLSYRFTGDGPDAVYDVDGVQVWPVYEKIRELRYFGNVLLKERIVWLSFGTVRVVLDGVAVDVRTSEPEQPSPFLDSRTIRRELSPDAVRWQGRKPRVLSNKQKALLRLADSWPVRRRFRNAWVLIDRVHNADDSAEHLFTYLRKHSRKTNAWFVLEAGAPDHTRLRRRYRRRVVAHGSLRWRLLMLNAQHLISTHIDGPIVAPKPITRLRDPRWRFTFLQHGVIKDDISRWLNTKDLEVLVTSTQAEYDSIAGDSPYRFTSREVKLTGLPRFDRLREVAGQYPLARRDLILIAPTWRSWLMGGSATGEHRHNADLELLLESDFIAQWLGLIKSSELRKLAEESGLKIGLLLHPNLQSSVTALEVPPYVEILEFEGANAQTMFARARVFVTDYSSMAFNAAYIERPVVYFQFDVEQFFSGGHAGRQGYYDFERDGYGPVGFTVDETLKAVADSIGHDGQPAPEYLRRIERAFPERDGRCCERVAAAVRQSTKRVVPEMSLVDQRERPVGGTSSAVDDLDESPAAESTIPGPAETVTEPSESNGGESEFFDVKDE